MHSALVKDPHRLGGGGGAGLEAGDPFVPRTRGLVHEDVDVLEAHSFDHCLMFDERGNLLLQCYCAAFVFAVDSLTVNCTCPC